MATTVNIKNAELRPAVNTIATTLAWLKPGLLALRFAQIKAALMPLAEAVDKERNRIVEDCAEYEEQKEGQLRRMKMVKQEVGGEEVEGVQLKDATEFTNRVNEVYDADVEVLLPFLLEDKHFDEEWEHHKLPVEERGRDLLVPDWSYLACVMKGSARVCTTGGVGMSA